MRSIFQRISNLNRRTMILGGVLIAAVVIGIFFLRPRESSQQLVTVERGTIVETVSVTGNTSPISSVELGFGNSGNISRVNYSIGRTVQKGAVLAELNTSDLYSQVQQAQANVDSQQAKLDGLKAGSRPEDVAASQASLDKAEQDLANMYAGIVDSATDSYAKANDAVRVQLDEFFSNAESGTPRLIYLTANSQARNNAEAQRVASSRDLDAWQAELSSGDRTNIALDTLLLHDLSYLDTVRGLLNSLSMTLENAPGLDATTLATYKANVTAALNQINTASKNLNTVKQNIASQKLTVSQSKAQLDLKKAGSSPQDIKAQEAQVASAVAQVQSARSKLQNSQIVAPISGVITKFDAKVGQFASPGTALVSIISEGAFEVEAQVSETDVSKLARNNAVKMTIDAFPNQTFTGTVFFIDPAQTSTEGVVGYKIKIAFDKSEARMKSGLTVNLDIETRKKEGVLILPQYAILQNDEGMFVQISENKTVKEVPIAIGLQDRDGNVEILSGVEEGQQVLNIGLKQQ